MSRAKLRKIVIVKSLILSGLGNLAAGMFFGTGYIVIDHLDGWLNPQHESTALVMPSSQIDEISSIAMNI
jgi:hypothetical protein